MGLTQHLLCRTAFFQHIATSEEPVVLNLWRVIAQEGMIPSVRADAIFNLLCRIAWVDAGIDRRAHIQGAPGRHRRCPVTPIDPADVEIDRVIERIKVAMLKAFFIPAGFERLERRN